jgi:Icc-related predicted phosphoesterase
MRLFPLGLVLALAPGVLAADTFIEKPYLQIGSAPTGADLVLLWHTANQDADWKVEIKKGSAWRAAGTPSATLVQAPAGKPIAPVAGKKAPPPPGPAIEPHRVYRAALNGLKSGEEFAYRVSQNGKVVFEANAKARKTGNAPYRFVTFGDTAQNTPSERAIVYQTSLAKPDFLFITGDIVYGAGRISEYRDHYFPIFNADEASATAGAPLIRSVPNIAAPGNHDSGRPNFQRYPDAMAYFLYWDQPLNGPLNSLDTKNIPSVNAEDLGRKEFLSGAADRFPSMANFSFNYGNSHWLVLDSNNYSDWTDADLRAWVKKDLESAKDATWRFVAFHHPGFNSAKEHFNDQWMRVLSDIFEQEKVDVVWAGHVHNYQRSFPLTFVPKPGEDGKLVAKNGAVAGEFKLDKNFADGASGKPKGVIYIVTGAGGAELYSPEMQKAPESWQPFTDKFVSEIHSFTVVDIDGKKMKVKQISETGEEVDAWKITK